MTDVFGKKVAELNLDKSDWQLVKFGDIAIQQKQTVDRKNTELTRYVKGEHMYSEDIHLREWGELKDEYLGPAFIRKFEEGDILYGSRRTYLRKVVLAPFEGITSNTTFVIKANEERIDKRLLPFIMLSEGFSQHSIKNSKGSVNPYVNWKDLAGYEFLLPNIKTQTELVRLFEKCDLSLESKNYALEKLEISLKSIQKDKLDRGYSSYDNPLPKEWKMQKIKEFAKVQAGSTPLRSNHLFFEGGSIPWLKTLDLNDGEIDDTEEKITELAIDKTSCKVKPINTVLVAMYGGFNQIGRTGILNTPAATNQAVAAIQVDESVILPEYLLYVLNAKKEYWKIVAISSRKDPNITKDDVENFPVPIPPLNIQRTIVDFIKKVLNSKHGMLTEIEAFKLLNKSIINQVF
ncbi:TPA: restriction endonuclease subunit S [Photobacterium damselae]